MTASDVITQIKSSPPEERATVFGFVNELSGKPARSLNAHTLEQSAQQVFDRHAELMDKLSQ